MLQHANHLHEPRWPTPCMSCSRLQAQYRLEIKSTPGPLAGLRNHRPWHTGHSDLRPFAHAASQWHMGPIGEAFARKGALMPPRPPLQAQTFPSRDVQTGVQTMKSAAGAPRFNPTALGPGGSWSFVHTVCSSWFKTFGRKLRLSAKSPNSSCQCPFAQLMARVCPICQQEYARLTTSENRGVANAPDAVQQGLANPVVQTCQICCRSPEPAKT